MKIDIKALAYATGLTVAFVSVLTIWSELSSPFKGWLTGVTGHHWVTKGVFSIVFFGLVYIISSVCCAKCCPEEPDVKKAAWYVIAATVLSGLVIFGFYVWHFFA